MLFSSILESGYFNTNVGRQLTLQIGATIYIPILSLMQNNISRKCAIHCTSLEAQTLVSNIPLFAVANGYKLFFLGVVLSGEKSSTNKIFQFSPQKFLKTGNFAKSGVIMSYWDYIDGFLQASNFKKVWLNMLI